MHGVAEINIVVEGKKVTVEFRTPTEGLNGSSSMRRRLMRRNKKRDAALKLITDK